MRRPGLTIAVSLPISIMLSVFTSAQTIQVSQLRTGSIVGTVTDLNGDPVPNAAVVLSSPEMSDRRTIVTPENGFFELRDVKPGVPYRVTISAAHFADWMSPAITLEPGQFKILADIQLRIPTDRSSVQVTYNPEEVATEQLKLEEKQRILGIFPNFYVSYDHDAEPLTTKMKFRLALKVSVDPVTIVGVALLSGLKQASDSPNYGQGVKGYGERFGANAADGFTDIMIGGAILPSLLHQDPRYFYQGTGTTNSRIRHAVLSPFITRGDNGDSQPNYSSIGGDLASSAISNAYYPPSNRGAGLTFSNFAIGTAERIGANLAQEFLLPRFTHRSH